ncbi:MEDS domain-containing protein [Saccharomonospora piscinae]|uniref:MEDS domain-containing protein n=1 Tax=Saccharomonospora piscinae TaxID=687388 RepID=UPI000465C6D0|nr:MEDS domain-containing protein [Saccharomonospora piscinae]
MRRTSTLTVPVGHGWHDHACWFHSGNQHWREVLVPYLGEGVARDERLLYLSDKSEDELAEDLALLPGRDELVRSGQLTLLPMAPVRGVVGGSAVATQLARVRQAAEDAVSDGYRCLRLAADSAHPVQGRDDAIRFVHSELLVDELVSRAPLLLLCGYDGRFVDRRAAAALAFVHPIRQRAAFGIESGLYADMEDPHCWRLQGELDLASREVFEIALDAVPIHGDLHLKLGDLTFIDVGGVHALASLAERIAPRRLILDDPPTTLSRIVELSRADFPAMRRVPAVC